MVEPAERSAITDLVAGYLAAVDASDWDALDRYFTSDVKVEYDTGLTISSRDELARYFKSAHDLFALTRQQIVTINAARDEDGAGLVARAKVLVHLTEESGSVIEITGSTIDRAYLTADGWRIWYHSFIPTTTDQDS